MTLQEKLYQLRKRNGLSQEELAAQLEVSRQAVSKWEQGVSQPDLTKLTQLADIFHVSTDSLLREELPIESLPQPQARTPPETPPPPSIFCGYCGKSNAADSVFCGYCGAPFFAASAVARSVRRGQDMMDSAAYAKEQQNARLCRPSKYRTLLARIISNKKGEKL